jgi:hypothetical protein
LHHAFEVRTLGNCNGRQSAHTGIPAVLEERAMPVIV